MRGRRDLEPPPPLPTPPRRGRRRPETEFGSGGDGLLARPPGSLHRRGRRMPAGRPDLVSQVRLSGIAMNRIASPDRSLISTVRLPSERASVSALLTSAGVPTGLPPTSRITSPVL